MSNESKTHPDWESMRNEVFAHYDRLLACRTPSEFQAEGWYDTNCILCRVYSCNSADCLGCPISETTGDRGCVGTPWMGMANSLEKFCKHESDENLSAAISSINKEVEFLKTVDFKKAVSIEYIDMA